MAAIVYTLLGACLAYLVIKTAVADGVRDGILAADQRRREQGRDQGDDGQAGAGVRV